MFNARIDFDINKAISRKNPVIKRAQAALDIQVIKDSNYFCPEDDGTLQSSALLSSRVGEGLVSWSTPYARRQYYEAPNKSKDKNPNARMKWFEEAKAREGQAWNGKAQGATRG